MRYTTLISAAELTRHLEDPDWAIVDCRFSLADTEQGRRDYVAGHIPSAVYAHLDEDLSGPIVPGKTGRHPLPTPEEFSRTLSGWGIDSSVQVVAYDASGGSIAARLWWMLRWLGHEAAVLDGGWKNWQTEAKQYAKGLEERSERAFAHTVSESLVASASDVLTTMDDPSVTLIDCRGADRYRGENETIDPVAGHIPGALSLPYVENLAEDGLFLPRELLRERFERVMSAEPERTIFYCGSGVTAAHNVLAMAHAGLGDARLYAGSWSEWITDPERPVEVGG